MDKGHEYERFVRKLIPALSMYIGETYFDENITLNTIYKGREIDITCLNEKSCLLIECKNTNEKTGSGEIDQFESKVIRRYREEQKKLYPKKIYAFFVSNGGFSRGVLNYLTPYGSNYYDKSGEYMRFLNIEDFVYNNECVLAIEMLSSNSIINPLFLTKPELSNNNLKDLFEIHQSYEISLEERIAICGRLLSNKNRIKEKWIPSIYERMSNALFRLKRYTPALTTSNQLFELAKNDSAFLYESEIISGLSQVRLENRKTPQKKLDYYHHRLTSNPKEIMFMQLIGDISLKQGDRKTACKMYWDAFNSPYTNSSNKYTMLSKLFAISDTLVEQEFIFLLMENVYAEIVKEFSVNNITRIIASKHRNEIMKQFYL